MKKVYVSLSRFCEDDDGPRRSLVAAGFTIVENSSGRRLRGDELVAAVGDADGVIAGVEAYDAATLSAFPRVRCISRCGIGTDAIDLEAARRQGIAVLNTPDEVTEPVAQVTIAMILVMARNFPQQRAALREGRWAPVTGALLSEWTVGLIGFGRIGRAVERYLRPFGSKVIVTDPGLRQEQLPADIRLVDLASLLRDSDLVSLHAGRLPSEGTLIGRAELAAMKRGSRLVNTARGYLVDEAALQDALVSGHLAGAALDVYQTEPYSGPLTQLPQVLCTPHIGSLTRSSRRAMEMKAATNLIDFLGGSR